MRFVTKFAVFFLFLCAFAARPLNLQGADSRDALVVSVDWLKQHLTDPGLVVLTTGTEPTYKARHIAGAQFVTMDQFATPHDMSDPSQPMLELPDAALLHDRLQQLGISNSSKIVFYYSDQYYSPSTRIIFTLNWAGFGSRTVLVNGGLKAWIAAGYPTTTEIPAIKPGTLAPLKVVPSTVEAPFMQANGKTPGVALVDVRGSEMYDGRRANGRDGKFLGHIPGALDLPLELLWDDSTEMLRPQAELEAIFAKAGVKPADTVVGYCFVGQRATATLFAARTLGHKVLLYDGSMDDWTKRNLPLELPAKKGGGM